VIPMPICKYCGNEKPDDGVCPFCGDGTFDDFNLDGQNDVGFAFEVDGDIYPW